MSNTRVSPGRYRAGHQTCYPDHVVLEWWNGERKLTLYVESRGVSYVRVWGPDIDTEMEDGDVQPDGQGSIAELLSWVYAAESGR